MTEIHSKPESVEHRLAELLASEPEHVGMWIGRYRLSNHDRIVIINALRNVINAQLQPSNEAINALRFFADDKNWRQGGRCDPNCGLFDGQTVALDALAHLADVAPSVTPQDGPTPVPPINPNPVTFNPLDIGFTLRDDSEPEPPQIISGREDYARDVFAEITAKAIPVTDSTSDDPERVRHYIVPVGPIHRAAGKLGFQMFDGEVHAKRMADRIRELEAVVAPHDSAGPTWAERLRTSAAQDHEQEVRMVMRRIANEMDRATPPVTGSQR